MQKLVAFLFSIVLIASIPTSFASSDRDEKLEFAGTLEETLGHFWALELNLDERNAELALVHATHPISELYDTMSEHLSENPTFDTKIQNTLMELQNRANTDVNRQDAQMAIDEAKEIVLEARMIVVGEEISDDTAFKMQLINQLLETSKVEYKEAVADGIIEEVAEFQDGSAFIWRSQQVFKEFENDVDPVTSSRITELYSDVWTDFDARKDPSDVANLIDSVISEFEELSGFQSTISEHEEQVFGLSPLKQLQKGIAPSDVTCASGFEILFKNDGSPACVKPSSIQKLISRGWSQ